MKKYTAAEYRRFIAELLAKVEDITFLRQIYSIIKIRKERTGE